MSVTCKVVLGLIGMALLSIGLDFKGLGGFLSSSESMDRFWIFFTLGIEITLLPLICFLGLKLTFFKRKTWPTRLLFLFLISIVDFATHIGLMSSYGREAIPALFLCFLLIICGFVAAMPFCICLHRENLLREAKFQNINVKVFCLTLCSVFSCNVVLFAVIGMFFNVKTIIALGAINSLIILYLGWLSSFFIISAFTAFVCGHKRYNFSTRFLLLWSAWSVSIVLALIPMIVDGLSHPSSNTLLAAGFSVCSLLLASLSSIPFCFWPRSKTNNNSTPT